MSTSTNARGAARLLSIQRFLAHAREQLSFDVGFLLWDGSTVPADLSSSALAIAIADEHAVAALMRLGNPRAAAEPSGPVMAWVAVLRRSQGTFRSP